MLGRLWFIQGLQPTIPHGMVDTPHGVNVCFAYMCMFDVTIWSCCKECGTDASMSRKVSVQHAKHSKSHRQALAVVRPVVLHCRNATLHKEGGGSTTHAARTQLRSAPPPTTQVQAVCKSVSTCNNASMLFSLLSVL